MKALTSVITAFNRSDSSGYNFKALAKLIGVLLALVVLLGVVLWRVFATTSSRVAPATVVVSTTPPMPAEVFVDGKPVGSIKTGVPFTKELTPGEHKVAVVVAEPCHLAVRVRACWVKIKSKKPLTMSPAAMKPKKK